MTEMPADLLAALNADLAVPGRWLLIAANETHHEHTTPGEGLDAPPVVTVTRHVTATLTCAARSLSLVFMLEGMLGAPPASIRMHYMGTPFVTADAALIARIDNAVGPLVAARGAELLSKLTEPLE